MNIPLETKIDFYNYYIHESIFFLNSFNFDNSKKIQN